MGKRDKKKGKGAEKTALKTEKKASARLKKRLEEIGEEDIDVILAQIEREQSQRLQEVKVDGPGRRVNFTLTPHPDKDELIMFGGEYFDGRKTYVYDDLFFYDITANVWTLVKSPGGPSPRSGHQAVATSTDRGQIWVFGGEFASPSQSQFRHHRDLWLFRLADKKWERVERPGGPSARSGHRMVLYKKQLIVFGGFHDNARTYKYFNDVYKFDTETYVWCKLDVAGGKPPEPRSGCVVVPADGRILIYGGYAKETAAKNDDDERGRVFADGYALTPDANLTKWRWSTVKLTGGLTPRVGLSATSVANNPIAYVFGGVFDVENTDDDLSGTFFNDCFCLDTAKLRWRKVVPGKNTVAVATVEPEPATLVQETQDGIFKLTVSAGGASSSPTCSTTTTTFQPVARSNCGLAFKRGTLFLYGGMYEVGDRQVTLADFYSLDVRKMDEWRTIVADDRIAEWYGSESEASDDDDEESEDSEMSTAD